jgi:stage II sporulation protein D
MRWIWCLLAAGLLLVGCAGPKRLPPVVSRPELPERPDLTDLTVPSLQVPPALLGVGLLENETGLDIWAGGPAGLVDARTGVVLLEVDGQEQVVHLNRDGGQVAWQQGAHRGQAGAVVLRPNDPATRVGQGDSEFRGEFLVITSPVGRGLTLVNSVDIESYLKGVVPWEIGRHPVARLAALQAQAVAARTYTVSHLGARRNHGFDLYASVMDQVYRGSAGEDELCNQAVDATAGLVLRDGEERIEAYYSACCGGTSSNIDEVWAREGRRYLRSADDGPAVDGTAFCSGSRHFHWRETWTCGQLDDILAETLPAYLDWIAERPARETWTGRVFVPREAASDARRPGHLRNLEILSRTTSGRVAELVVSTDAGEYHVRGDRTRWILRPASGNPSILRSAMFDVELERDGARLTRVATRGRGYGHGIGLCQTGALERASAGQSFQEILAHYYPGAELTVLAPAGID